MQLEIAVQDVAGARIAGRAGADRIELCSALSLGGVTPSIGLIERVVDAATIPVHVLVRPRPGDFTYATDELDVVLSDVRLALAAGADGVVVGALTEDSRIDTVTLARIRDTAGHSVVTFHRAFDLVRDVADGLDVLAAHGVRRVLTSGGESTALSGIDALRSMVALSAGRVEIMAGGGVSIESIGGFASIGVDAVHLSAKRVRRVAGGFSLGSGSREGSMEWDETDPVLVAEAVSGSS